MTTKLGTHVETVPRIPTPEPEVDDVAADSATDTKPHWGFMKRWARTALCVMDLHGGTWTFLTEGACNQNKTCDRCETLSTRTKHDHLWQYTHVGSCAQLKECVRCSQAYEKRTKHEGWGETYTIDSDTDAHRCTRCGEVDTWSTDTGD